MTTLPIEIVNKIMHYLAKINAEEKTFINYEILTYNFKKNGQILILNYYYTIL